MPGPHIEFELPNISQATDAADSWTLPFIGGRAMVKAAFQLQREFGDAAVDAACLRAAMARSQDNPYRYCLWKEVARLLSQNTVPDAVMQRH